MVFVLVGIIIALVTGWYTYRSYQHSREVASKGAELNIGLYSTEAPNNLYILLPFNNNRMFLIPIVFSIKNNGATSAKNVELFITVSSDMCQTDVDRQISKIGIARGVKHASEEGRTKYLTDSYISVGDIPPKTIFNVSYEFSWNKETIIRMPVKATSKDGVDFTANILATISLSLEVKILQNDNKPIIKHYSIEFRRLAEDEKLNDFVKREEELIRKLQEGSMPANEKNNQTYQNIRIVTFGAFKEFEDEIKTKKEKNERQKMKLIRCDGNSIKYIDCMILGDRLILGK